MKVKEKTQYTIWQNVCFMVRTAWKTHKRVLLMCVVIAAVQVALNLAQLYVTPEILAKVEQGAAIKDLLLTIGLFSAALFLLMGAKRYLIANRLPAEVDVRSAVIRLITRKTCETSYPNTRDPKVLKMKEQADAATSSNRDATEHIWTTLTQILTNVTGFAIYTPFSKCVTHYDTFSTSAAKMSWALPRGMRLLRKPIPPSSDCGAYATSSKVGVVISFPQPYLLQCCRPQAERITESSQPTIFKSADFPMRTGTAVGVV